MPLDYERLWKQLWIENLEEEINKSKQANIQKQEELNRKYPITKEDILMFANLFFNVKLEKCTKFMLPSEYMVFPWTELIPFWNRNEIVNQIAKDKIKLYFKLFQRKFILIHLKNYTININSEKNNYIRKLLEEYRVKKWDPQNRNYISYKWYGESIYKKDSLWNRFKNKFSNKPDIVEIKRIGANFFMTDLLDERMEDFIENLDYGIDFDIWMVDKDLFITKSLIHIESFESNMSRASQIESVYNEIKEQVWEKNNFPWIIQLSYPLSDYIDNKNQYYDIIYILHEKEYITVKEIYILESSINFIIQKINRFDNKVIDELQPIHERISFIWWTLKLDSDILVSWKKKGQKIYELIDLIVLWIKEHHRLEISYDELKYIYFNNPDRFPYLKSSINKNWNYNLFKEKLEIEKIEDLKEIYNQNIDKLINNVFCLSYFNSSLAKEKTEFILKENITWLHINQH